MFAMLLEMTWTLSSWAIMPVAAVCRARIVSSPRIPGASGRHFGQPLDRLAAQVAVLLQHPGDRLVGAGDLDQAVHLDHGAHVRLLDCALGDRRIGVRGRRL